MCGSVAVPALHYIVLFERRIGNVDAMSPCSGAKCSSYDKVWRDTCRHSSRFGVGTLANLDCDGTFKYNKL